MKGYDTPGKSMIDLCGQLVLYDNEQINVA
ncbi:hypothetical protein J2Z70_000957 [Paenibacillus silagei]|uniref:Uncharacterized protein n=1 Tax=Paenibacillus silagei TaxID=1670801 RepID=A0ABS4NN68_9BACL|nr:hypothetical protein [Paenibacillus silagei]